MYMGNVANCMLYYSQNNSLANTCIYPSKVPQMPTLQGFSPIFTAFRVLYVVNLWDELCVILRQFVDPI